MSEGLVHAGVPRSSWRNSPRRGRATSKATLPAIILGGNAVGVSALLTGDVRATIAVLLIPVLFVAFALLADTDATVLVVAALTLELTIPQLNEALPLGIATEIFPSDLVVLFGCAAWAISRFHTGAPQASPYRWTRSPVLGVPLVLFTLAIASAAVRGHLAYGASLIGRPARMFLYAAIAFAIVRIEPRRLYKGIVIGFYTATVWQLLNAAYYMATGGSQSIAPDLSTGGTRVLSIAVSLYLSGTFFLALINLSLKEPFGPKALHASMLILSAVEIGLAFSRGTFITVALLATLLFLFLRDVRAGALAPLPLAIPVLIAGLLILARTDSTVIPTFVERVQPSLSADQSVEWRRKANEELVKQFHQSPVDGVGFGKDIHFVVGFQDVDTTQQAHNDFLYILAGSGIVGLASFLLVVSAALGNAFVRLRRVVEPHERALILFAIVTASSFLLNGLVEPLITLPSVVLTIWTLLLLPMAIAMTPRERQDPERAPTPVAD